MGLVEHVPFSPPNISLISLNRKHYHAVNLDAPDSPTFRVLDDHDEDKIVEHNSVSDLALHVTAPYIASIALPESTHKTGEDGDSVDLTEEDTSLVLARNNLSASFSKWEFDPEDGAFHNSNQLLLLEDDDSSTVYAPETKRVHFMADPDDAKMIYCQRYESQIELTSRDILLGWYTSKEIKKFRRHVHTDAHTLRKLESSSYMENFYELNRSCAKSISITQSKSQMKLASRVAASQHRGQEGLIFFELFRTERKRMTKEVLSAQAAYRECCTSDELSSLLGAMAKTFSRRSRRFAYVVGLGDANVAQKLLSTEELEFIMTSTPRQQYTRKCLHNDETSCTDNSSYDDYDIGPIEI
jgi:hypothetical protein